MIAQSLTPDSPNSLQRYLFTASNYQVLSDQYLSDCLLKYQTSIDYTYEIKLENKEEIVRLIKSQLKMNGRLVQSVMFTRDNVGIVTIEDSDLDCLICKRRHEQASNRVRLRFAI